MATIVLHPGDTLVVQFKDSDGEFTIDFDSKEYPDQIVVCESAGLDGNIKGKAFEIMHHERFGDVDPGGASDEELTQPVANENTPSEEEPLQPRAGYFVCSSGILRNVERFHCGVRTLPNNELVVITWDEDNFETGEYTYYPTIQAVEAALGRTFTKLYI